MLLLIFLSKVELFLINVHFSYVRAAHGIFCPLSYAQPLNRGDNNGKKLVGTAKRWLWALNRISGCSTEV